MRAVTAFFAGVGTVAVAITAGLGGGLLLGDIMSPQQPKHQSSEVTRLEQRMSPQPIPASTGTSEPVPYMAPNQVANTTAEPSQQAQPPAVQSPQKPAQQAQSPQAQQAATRPAESKPQEQNAPAPATAVVAPPKPGNEPRATPDDAFAKARDADLRRDERRAEDKRRYERRKWSDKRKWRQRGDDDLREVEASIREDTERRSLGRNGSFFGRDDDRFERSEPRPMFGREPGYGRSFSLFDD